MFDSNIVFILLLSTLLIFFMQLVFRIFPKEKYQFIAAIPKKKEGSLWKSINYTFYGFITATSIVFALSIFYVLMLLQNYEIFMIAFVVFPVMIIAFLSVKFLTTLIEGKKHVFSVGAALFVSFISAPFIVYVVNKFPGTYFNSKIDFIYFMAAASVAFLFGEGTGRMACVSFGCCYGKPVKNLSSFWQWLFKNVNFVFEGKTKKISYTSGYDGIEVVPVQAITSVFCSAAGVAGLAMILNGYVQQAFLFSSVFVFFWRFISEFLRADYRGGTKISAYQIFSIIAIVYICLITFFGSQYFQMSFPKYNIVDAFEKFWTANTLLLFQFIWIFSFVFFGRSTVTESTIEFSIKKDCI